jgi:hypothetical protein
LSKRDQGVTIASNAERIRLCTKTVVSQHVYSAGISGRIRALAQTKVSAISDTYFVAERAGFEP